eukprot:3617624-Prymnesium_polylepis.1
MPLAWQCRIGSTGVGWACCAHFLDGQSAIMSCLDVQICCVGIVVDAVQLTSCRSFINDVIFRSFKITRIESQILGSHAMAHARSRCAAAERLHRTAMESEAAQCERAEQAEKGCVHAEERLACMAAKR